MHVFFASNRDFVGKPRYFGHQFQAHPDFFRVGWADFNDAQLEQDLPPASEVHVAAERYTFDAAIDRYRFTRVGSTEVFPAIISALQVGGAAKGVGGLVFIPGFNYTFLESLCRAAHLAHIYSTAQLELVPIVFSWPSDGVLSVSAYKSDRLDAELSGRAMARAFALFLELLRKLRRDEQCGATLHLLAHSMGVYALRHAVVTLMRPDFPRWPAPIFDSVVLAAGDDDRNTLEDAGKLADIVRLGNRIDVYINPNDKPVRLGDDFDGEFDRLGAYGPIDATVVQRFSKPLSIIDCRHVDYFGQDASRHQYYRISPVVVDDIRDVFAATPASEARHRVGRFQEESLRYLLLRP